MRRLLKWGVRLLVGSALSVAMAFSVASVYRAQFGEDMLAAARSALADAGIDFPSLLEVAPSVTPSAVEVGIVEEVVDGDTLKVAIADQTKTVRLIGIDAPESVHSDPSKNCEEGTLASDHTKALLSIGATVYLVKDTSDVDKYGRLLRYVWLKEPSGEPSNAEAEQSMLNAIIVRAGYAQAKAYKPDTAWSPLFARLGDDASAQGLGVSYKWTEL